MTKHAYQGPFKTEMQDFVELKQALGYKYLAAAACLRRFDRFTVEKHNSASSLTKEIVMDWCDKRPYEKQENLCSRASTIRQFALYLDNLGRDAYVIPKNYFKSGEKYVPYIYSDIELHKFFLETDKCHYCSQCPYRHLVMPVLFRLIYSCGLRLSEARLLKLHEVDLNNGILTINHSKKDNSRLVPMSDGLIKRCRAYSKQVHCFSSNGERYFFPMTEDKPLTGINIYRNFRKFLWKAGISHRGKGAGPRVHDFRHTFAVHRMKKWVVEGKDLMAFLPILRVYLGHDSFNETAYYLRLTADVFPEITFKLERAYPDLIPVIEGGVHEAD